MDKENNLSFFVLKLQFIKLHYIYLGTTIVPTAFGSSVWLFSVLKIHHQVKNCTNRQWIFNLCKILRKYQNFTAKGKFHGSAWNSTAYRNLWIL